MENKKTNKSKVKKTGILDIEKFDASVAKKEDTIASMIMKIKTEKYFATLPDWMDSYPIPYGTLASGLSCVKCMMKLNEALRVKKIEIHPAAQLDRLVTDNDVTVSVKGVSYVDENAKLNTYPVAVGYLVPSVSEVKRILHASTADIVSTDAPRDNAGNHNPPEWPENLKVPITDCERVRIALESDAKSKSVSRSEIFSFLMDSRNVLAGVRLHGYIGDQLPNFTQNDQLESNIRNYYIKRNIKIPEGINGKIVGTYSGTIPSSEKIDTVYRMLFKSNGIRASRAGGGLSHGFERFAMSRLYADILNIVLDFLNVLRCYDTMTVVLKDSSYLSTEEMRVMVANGISVVLPSMIYPVQPESLKPGIYSGVAKNANAVEFVRLPDSHVKPELANKTIRMGKSYEYALKNLAQEKRVFSYVYLDSRLNDYTSVFSLLPSATADTMQIIVASGIPGKSAPTFEISALVKRCSMAISCRNYFIHYRKPFFTMDIMSNFVKWQTEIVLPRISKGKEFTINLVEAKLVDKVAVEPLQFNFKDFNVTVDQVIPSSLRLPNIIRDSEYHERVYIYQVMAGLYDTKGKKKFIYVEDDGAAWVKECEEFEVMTEVEFFKLLSLVGKQYANEFNLVRAKIVEMNEDEEENKKEKEKEKGKDSSSDVDESDEENSQGGQPVSDDVEEIEEDIENEIFDNVNIFGNG